MRAEPKKGGSMMDRRRWFGGALIVAAVLTFPGFVADGWAQRPKVAVMDFDFGAVHHWWSGEWDIGKGVADLIVDELVNDGTFAVIERKQLDTVLAEQEFAHSDRADPSAAQLSKIGKVAGVKAIITGSITKFGFDDKSIGGGGGAFGGGKFGLGGAKVKNQKAIVAVTARMIDTTTGEILASVKGNGESSRKGFALGGGGGGGAGAIGGIEMGSDNFRETGLGEATEKAVQLVVQGMIAKASRVSAQ
jgi:curli biogenesis system outer membrane secretion channel CsgG